MDSQLFAGPVIGIFCSGLNAYCMQTGPLFLRISGSSGVLKAFLLERNRQLSCNPKKKKKNWVHLSTSVYSTPGPCGPLTEEDVAVRVAVCFKLDCKAQTLSTEQAIQAAAGLKGWYRSTPLPGRVLVQEAEPVQAAAYGGL